MKMVVVSCSLTGNNEALANSVAGEFEVEHIKITEPKPRNMGSIVLDLIFNRTPQVQPIPERLGNYDLVLFFGPIYMGQVAPQLRAYLKHLGTNPCRYAFFSISGGADGLNPKLAGELKDGVAEGFCVEVEHDDKKTSRTPRLKMSIQEPIRLNLQVYDTQL